jgi:hypothetical protein
MFTFMNYFVFHWQLELDALYMHPLEISGWLAVTFVLTGADNLGYSLLEYRFGELGLNESFAENIKWLPFLQVPLLGRRTILACTSSQLLRLSWPLHPPLQTRSRISYDPVGHEIRALQLLRRLDPD